MENTYNRKHHTWLNRLPVIACAMLLAAVLLYGNVRLISSNREDETERTALLIGLLREKLPEVSDAEIMKYVKQGVGDEQLKKTGSELMQRFGYDEYYFSKNQNRMVVRLIIFNVGVVFIAGCGALTLYFLHRRKVHREVEELEAYFTELNRGSYDLQLEHSMEGDLSILQSEIFKVTQLLRTSAEESKAKSEDLSRWLADISHQLKTPIASIRINLDNMLDEPDMPPDLQHVFLKECSMQLEWVSSLVQTLLKLARIDAGTVILKREEMDLLAVAREAEEKLGILSEIAEVKIVWESEPNGDEIDPSELPAVPMMGDAAWQLEAVSNILKNCIEHSTAGSKVFLSIRDTTVFKELVIRDMGEGIPEEDLPHIFERFYRAKNAKRESVGIGLSLAASVIREGGGRISAVSEPGKGSTFTIRYLV